ncbi:MAG: methyltransferase domain-containing protein [Bacteroidota bacterium]
MAEKPELASKQEVEAFYNSFKEHQLDLGVNVRHRTIFKNLKKIGLKPGSNVLEIGCGIGTVSSLILSYITRGKFVGADISDESIAVAKKINAKHTNAEFIVNDMSAFSHKTVFDFVVLPDVMEHIPVEQHNNLFKVLSAVTSPNAVVLINFPEPHYLNWVRKNNPEKLQIIDQSLSMQDLLNDCYPHGFKLFSMHSYTLHYTQPDYTSVVLKKNMDIEQFQLKSAVARGLQNTRSKLY